jgi:hypothetical protein
MINVRVNSDDTVVTLYNHGFKLNPELEYIVWFNKDLNLLILVHIVLIVWGNTNI